MREFFPAGQWRISSDGRGFETGAPTTGMVTLGFEQMAGLLVANEPALKTSLEALAQASARRFGEEDFLVRLLIAYTGVKATPPSKMEDLPPHTKAGGSNGPWPDCDDR